MNNNSSQKSSTKECSKKDSVAVKTRCRLDSGCKMESCTDRGNRGVEGSKDGPLKEPSQDRVSDVELGISAMAFYSEGSSGGCDVLATPGSCRILGAASY